MIDIENMDRENEYGPLKDKSYEIENMVGFLGVEGSYSHKAFKQYFGNDYVGIGLKTFRDIFKNLENKRIQFAIVPIENSSTGGITEIYDLLMRHGFFIVGEKCVKVDHNLLGIKGASIDDITMVYSHPQGLSQCDEFFLQFPDWKQIPFGSTAGSAEYIKNCNDIRYACVAASEAADLYGLQVISKSISSSSNFTRFVVISKEQSIMKDNNKISIQLSISHTAGSLYRVLRHFEQNNKNMLKIESRPVKGKPWEYYFFIDFTGNIMDEATKDMLQDIEKESVSLKFLGNYKSDLYTNFPEGDFI